ncbi:B12-binding domain-containing radical SAM protein [Candidatus Aerophobetes bacterium]|nr:B12-binding domain-containing radical SAM protein [Candidatus Aerophobetes bacterium]
MKIILISPTWKKKVGVKRRYRDKLFNFPPHSLLAVAALTPKDIEVKLIDERMEKIDFNEKSDLVGITVMTASSPRAYEIADEFRKRDIPVVLGGIHVTALPQEAAQHADAIVIGEAEGLWEKLIEDFTKRGKKGLSKFYQNHQKPDPSIIPFPRRDLLKGKGYLLSRFLQISRGCPFNCSFCSVSKFFGKKYRFRPVEKVIEEIKGMAGKSLATRFFGFLDDNIVGNVSYAKQLFKALIPCNILWAGQSSINIAQDEELLDLASRSGCKGLFIGFESICEESLKEINKHQNKIKFYKNAIKKIHQFGISIEGAFIFGFDHDDKNIFQKTIKFIEKVKLDAIQFAILTPLPETRLYEKLEKEGRIIDKNWANYDLAHAVFQPKLMTPQELKKGFDFAYKKIYRFPSILKRSTGLIRGRRWKYFVPLLTLNLAYRRMFKKRGKDNSFAGGSYG